MSRAETSALDHGLQAFAQKRWKRARQLLLEAAQESDRPLLNYHLGLLYWRGLGGPRDPEAAVACFERAAKEGHAAAQSAYALALRSGIGAEKDNERARQLFRSAAAAGDLHAMTQLATLSEPAEARDWLERAAELGHAPAMLDLSDMLMRGEPVEALAWLYAAVALTADEATQKRAAALAREMTASEISAAHKLGRARANHLNRQEWGRI